MAVRMETDPAPPRATPTPHSSRVCGVFSGLCVCVLMCFPWCMLTFMYLLVNYVDEKRTATLEADPERLVETVPTSTRRPRPRPPPPAPLPNLITWL